MALFAMAYHAMQYPTPLYASPLLLQHTSSRAPQSGTNVCTAYPLPFMVAHANSHAASTALLLPCIHILALSLCNRPNCPPWPACILTCITWLCPQHQHSLLPCPHFRPPSNGRCKSSCTPQSTLSAYIRHPGSKDLSFSLLLPLRLLLTAARPTAHCLAAAMPLFPSPCATA